MKIDGEEQVKNDVMLANLYKVEVLDYKCSHCREEARQRLINALTLARLVKGGDGYRDPKTNRRYHWEGRFVEDGN